MWITKVRIAAAMLLIVGLGTGIFLYEARTQAQPRAEEKTFLPGADSTPALAGKPQVRADNAVPRVEDLIRYLNDNARLAEGLRCTNVAIDWRGDGQAVGLGGMLLCQRPRHVRFQAKVLGNPALDIGCNDEEYWCWISKGEPHNLQCGRREEETRSGPRRWSMLYRPEWLLDVLGIAEYDPEKEYSLRATREHLELSETVQSPQGKPLRKVIVLHRLQKAPPDSQIAAIVLKDGDDKVLCRADIKKVAIDKETGARLTCEAVLTFPRERMEVRLSFNNPQIVKLSAERAAVAFALKSAPYIEKTAAAVDAKEPAAVIQIDLAKENMQARYHEDVLKLSGRPDSALSLRVLQEQLRAWAGKEKQVTLCIRCPANAEYATLKAVLAACREVGIRTIEVCTAD